MNFFLLILMGYILGSIPFGYLVARFGYNLDIREYGSGNIGVTNILRVCGKKAAFLVFLGDVLKGTTATLLALRFGGEAIGVIAGIGAIVGHIYSVFLGFKGGKAVAVGFGVTLALSPLVALLTMAVWASTIYISKYVSLGSVLGAVVAPVLMYLLNPKVPYLIFALVGSGFVLYKHIPNIKRLWSGTEYKIGQKVDR